MNRVVRIVTLLVAVSAFAFGAAPLSGAQGGDEKPEASEVGVTADEIRIAVIADIDTPVAPGLFKGSADAVEGFAKYINKTGGLAGRKVVVDVIDSKLNADEARNAVIKACAEDFAMVGTAGRFLHNTHDPLACAAQT